MIHSRWLLREDRQLEKDCWATKFSMKNLHGVLWVPHCRNAVCLVEAVNERAFWTPLLQLFNRQPIVPVLRHPRG